MGCLGRARRSLVSTEVAALAIWCSLRVTQRRSSLSIVPLAATQRAVQTRPNLQTSNLPAGG